MIYRKSDKFIVPMKQVMTVKESYDNVIVIGGAVKTSNALVATREGFDVGINIK